MNDCVFCKIINNEIPRAEVYEDENVIAMIPLGYITKGHVLVIPKKHSNTILDTEDQYLCSCITAVKKIAKAVMDSTGCTGFNIHQNNFKDGNQEVPHLHFHIIPRFKDDGLKVWGLSENWQENEMQSIADNIKKFI